MDDDLYEDEWLEWCPRCKGACDGCMTCWDIGGVPHEHPSPDRT